MLAWLGRQVKKRLYSWETRNFVETSGEILSTKHRPICPKCETGLVRPDRDNMGLRTCSNPECKAQFSLETLGATYAVFDVDVETVLVRERRHSLRLVLVAQAILIGAAAWAIFFESWPTLLGGGVLALYLCVHAMIARYRAWQIENKRMFEEKAPFWDYMLQELGLRTRS